MDIPSSESSISDSSNEETIAKEDNSKKDNEEGSIINNTDSYSGRSPVKRGSSLTRIRILNSTQA